MSDSREQFEAYCREELEWTDDDLKTGHPGSNQYFWDRAAAGWHFWQASRQALEIQLPIRGSDHHDPNGSSDPISRAYDLGVTDCATFIAEQGIRTKY